MECVSPAKALAFNGRRLLERSLGFERDLSLTQSSRSEFFQKSLASMIFLVDELNDAILRITLEQLFSSGKKHAVTWAGHFKPLPNDLPYNQSFPPWGRLSAEATLFRSWPYPISWPIAPPGARKSSRIDCGNAWKQVACP